MKQIKAVLEEMLANLDKIRELRPINCALRLRCAEIELKIQYLMDDITDILND